MRKRTARLRTHALHGEPSLEALLADPVMLSLWHADHIDPTEARQLFSETASKLHHRAAEDGSAGRMADAGRRSRKRTRSSTQADSHEESGFFALT